MKSLLLAALLASSNAFAAAELVKLLRTPDGGLQPQALMDARGVLHLIYLKGDPKGCDVFYTRRETGGTNFSRPLRVNSETGSAVAVGTIRGAQLALGRNGHVHVAWNGNGTKKSPRGAPMLYARLNDAGDAFEAQRDVSTATQHLDGGGSVAADDAGHVYVLWHAASVEGPEGEQNRAVFLAQSDDDGKTFAAERKINPEKTGACACCGVKALTDSRGQLAVLYRSAAGGLDRDVTLLLSTNQARSFKSSVIGPWRIGTCPMSSMSLASGAEGSLLAAWEAEGKVFHSPINIASFDSVTTQSPAGDGKGRKHPIMLMGGRDGSRTLIAWTEGTGWQKGGSLLWELSDRATGRTTNGRLAGAITVWGRITAVGEADGTFTIIH
jgi:hypothetical protein